MIPVKFLNAVMTPGRYHHGGRTQPEMPRAVPGRLSADLVVTVNNRHRARNRPATIPADDGAYSALHWSDEHQTNRLHHRRDERHRSVLRPRSWRSRAIVWSLPDADKRPSNSWLTRSLQPVHQTTPRFSLVIFVIRRFANVWPTGSSANPTWPWSFITPDTGTPRDCLKPLPKSCAAWRNCTCNAPRA